MAALALVAGGAVYAFAVLTLPGQQLDARWFGRAQRLPAGGYLHAAVRSGLPVAGAGAALVLVVVALRRGRWREAVTATVAVPLSLVLAEVLKPRLPRPFYGHYAYDYNTFPSAHMAVAVSALAVVLLLWPWRRGRWVVLGVVAVLWAVEALANVAGFAHRPADVLGGAFLAVLVVAAVAAVLGSGLGLRPGDRSDAYEGPVGLPLEVAGDLQGRSGGG